MAHAETASGGLSRPGRTREAEHRPSDVVRRPPDVFDARTHAIGRLVIPVALGLVYGYWVAANHRLGGPITGGNVALGLLSALVFAVLCAALLVLAPRMPRELHAVLWAVFVGCAFGFLYYQSGSLIPTQSTSRSGDLPRTVLLSLIWTAGTFVTLFYRFYTRENAFGRRIR
jgi:hypothetical protein